MWLPSVEALGVLSGGYRNSGHVPRTPNRCYRSLTPAGDRFSRSSRLVWITTTTAYYKNVGLLSRQPHDRREAKLRTHAHACDHLRCAVAQFWASDAKGRGALLSVIPSGVVGRHFSCRLRPTFGVTGLRAPCCADQR